MTETTSPFAALDRDESGRQEDPRRRLAIGLGAGLVGVALLGFAVFAATQSDPEDSASSAFAASTVDSPRSAASGPDVAELTDEVGEVGALPVANTEELARSPFAPKYVAPAPPPPAPAVVDPLPVLVPAPTDELEDEHDDDGVQPGPLQTVAPSPPAASPPAAPAVREYRLVLTGVTLDAGVPTATFTIDGAVSTVKATDIFGPQRQLLLRSLQSPEGGPWTATIQVGDARPIDLVAGQAVYVQ